MPITQLRLERLVKECESFINAYAVLQANINRVITSSAIGDSDLRMAIQSELLAAAAIQPVYSIMEREQFNRNVNRNNRMREKMRRTRRAAGVPERNSPGYRMNAAQYQQQSQADLDYLEAMKGRMIEAGERNEHSTRSTQSPVAPPVTLEDI